MEPLNIPQAFIDDESFRLSNLLRSFTHIDRQQVLLHHYFANHANHNTNLATLQLFKYPLSSPLNQSKVFTNQDFWLRCKQVAQFH